MTEQDKFLADIGSDQNRGIDVMDQPFDQVPPADSEPVVETPPVIEGEPDGDDPEEGVKPKNRRERRLVQKLQEERESSIFLAGKLEAREEAKRLVTEEADYLKSVDGIYGNQTPEAVLATDLLKKAIIGARDDAKRSAIEEWRAEKQKEVDSEMKLTKQLDSFIDDIEDTYNVELTQAQEKSYLTLLNKMSPKDNNGNIIAYADHHNVFEVFQEKLKNKPADTRAKDLSVRSMTPSGASTETNLQDDTAARFLSENGII